MIAQAKSNNLLHIAAFPKDKTKWRISWFGEVAFPNRMIRRKQPSVLVHLTAVKTISSGQEDAGFFQKSAWVSVGILAELDEQHKVDIIDSGWVEYLTNELGMKDADNILWDLA